MALHRSITTFTLTDANGDEAVLALHSHIDDAATIATAIAAANTLGALFQPAGTITNAKVTSASIAFLFLKAQTTPGSPNPPLDAWFASVSDKAQLDFGNTAGAKSRLMIPAPVEDIFHGPPADLNVNPAQTDVAALLTGVEAYLKDGAGNVLDLYLGGTYRGTRKHRRSGRM